MDLKRWHCQKGVLILLSFAFALLFLSGFITQDFSQMDVVAKLAQTLPQFHKISPEKLELYEANKQIKQLKKKNAALVQLFKMDYDRIMKRIWRNYGKEIKTAADKYQLAPELIAAVIAVESRGKKNATARHGEKGLMQLRPTICHLMGVTDPFDPKQNIHAGTGYLNQLLKEFNKDIKLALAAYNAGPTIVRKYKGIPPWIYTQYYVQKILFLTQIS
ncbi:MAG: lytic transglycosylase domain-containing protein [Desulfobacteraceae bacterium]|jgi:soluble lytic murein transglycosylase-like protein